jgi:ribosomal protein L12E/L44/L45/RPP1/RPP2
LGTTSALASVSVPSGVQVVAEVQALCVATAAGGAILVTSPSVATQAVNVPSANNTAYSAVANLQGVGLARVLTNTSSQVRVVGSAAATNQYSLATIGWTDNRGKD